MPSHAGNDLPGIRRIDASAEPEVGVPGARIWLENGAKIELLEDELGSVEVRWFGPNDIGTPNATEIVDDATVPEVSIAKVGFKTVAEYVEFEDEADAREQWGDETVEIMLER